MQIVTSPHLDYVDNVRLTRFHWVLLLGIALAQLLDGYDFQITSYALPGFRQAFGLDAGQAGAVASAGNFGLLIGAIIFSQLADRFGRKPVFQVVLFGYAFGSLISGLAPNYPTLIVGRFIAGMGIGAAFRCGERLAGRPGDVLHHARRFVEPPLLDQEPHRLRQEVADI